MVDSAFDAEPAFFKVTVVSLNQQIKTICVHHFGPSRDEVMHKLLGIVILSINFSICTQD